jgi:diguanylate cyclase (GGDEF)-like protein
VDENDLPHLIDAWLATPALRLHQGFPPPLERIYAAEIAPARRRAVWISSLAGCITALALAYPVWRLFADAHALVRLIWFEIGIPISCLSHLLTYAPLSVRQQEKQVALAGALDAVCVAIMLSGSIHGGPALLMGTTVLIMLLGLNGSRFPFAITVIYAPAMLAIFIAGLPFLRQADGTPNLVLCVLMAVITFYAWFGNLRLEAETRKNYALMLRARLGEQHLSTQNAELSDLASNDALTGLANRRTYDSWIDQLWQQAEAGGTPLALILLDVDHFKLYNDQYGHPAGDACLRAIADCLREHLRDTTDFVARIGGEEFAIMLPGVMLPLAAEVAERMRCAIAALELPHAGAGPGKSVTVSLGVASLMPAANTQASLPRMADEALYAAKRTGRNCVFVADHEQGKETPVPRPVPCRISNGPDNRTYRAGIAEGQVRKIDYLDRLSRLTTR